MKPSLLFALMATAAGSGHCSQGVHEAARHEATVLLETRAGKQKVAVEVARRPSERERGLMYRQSLAAGHGMIFLFDAPEHLGFWMRNTYIPLDMIFIAADKKVVYIEENAEPLTLNRRGPDVATQFVLEVPGGWARSHGVEPGVSVRFIDLD